MNIQTAYRATSATESTAPKCPRCGATIFMAERSALKLCGGIRHTWWCDDCGQEFVTSINVFSRRAWTKVGH